MVDVAINVFGKPSQTALTLLSLLDRSGAHIHRIHLILERRQPEGAHFADLFDHLGDRLVLHRPWFFFGTRPTRSKRWMAWRPFRRALRYQSAWEDSDQPYLFITHNDVYYTADIIGAMLGRIDGHVAVGPVGQCWNCPAFYADRCGPERYMAYRPTYAEWEELVAHEPGPRAGHYRAVMDRDRPWPLPECRVNEWSMLVDLERARPLTMPCGPAVPLGALHGLDVGTQWFHDVINMGEEVAHFDIDGYALHAWASASGGGHAADLDRLRYDEEERRAEAIIKEQYPDYALRIAL